MMKDLGLKTISSMSNGTKSLKSNLSGSVFNTFTVHANGEKSPYKSKVFGQHQPQSSDSCRREITRGALTLGPSHMGVSQKIRGPSIDPKQ